jgi:hypothetical protein
MLAALLTGKTDQLPDWRDDPVYQDTKAAEDIAQAKASTLDAEYVRLSREINAGSEIIRTPPPGHPINQIQYASVQADRDARIAIRARGQAEDAAKRAVQTVGEEVRRAAWPGVEAAIDQLIIQLNAFQVVQTQVFDRTDVRPVEIGNAVGLNEGDLKTFCSNVRKELGR